MRAMCSRIKRSASSSPWALRHLAALEQLVPEGSVAGSRYGDQQMAHLDSERT
jgi:hypothetical protein